MRRRNRIAAAVALALVGAGPISAQQINTTSGGTDLYDGGALGVGGGAEPGYVGFGQLFSAPTGLDYLTRFSFFLADHPLPWLSPDLFVYRAFLGEWDGSAVTSIVWESGDQPSVTMASTASTDLEEYQETAFFPGLSLDPGAVYLAFLFPTLRNGLTPGAYDLDVMAVRRRLDSPAGADDGLGQAVVAAVYGTDEDVGAPTIFAPYVDYDVAFTATFRDPTVVPEPSTWALLATGLVGLGAAARRRRRDPA